MERFREYKGTTTRDRPRALLLMCTMTILVVLCTSCDRHGVFRAAAKAQRARRQLLCETDHEALLQAGREVANLVANGEIEPRGYKVHGDPHLPKGVEFPKIIVDLDPHALKVIEGYVDIVMQGAGYGFGVRIYPEDFVEPHPDFFYGHRKLAEGLWYYDDWYEIDPNYDSMIDQLMNECKERE